MKKNFKFWGEYLRRVLNDIWGAIWYSSMFLLALGIIVGAGFSLCIYPLETIGLVIVFISYCYLTNKYNSYVEELKEEESYRAPQDPP